MLPIELLTAPQVAQQIAGRVRARRLDRNWTQQTLAERSGMSLSSLKRFERTGQISFVSLAHLAIALDAVHDLTALFSAPPASLDDLLEKPTRKRGRST